MLNMIWRNKRQDTNVEKIYESEQSKQTSKFKQFVHLFTSIVYFTYNYDYAFVYALQIHIQLGVSEGGGGGQY